MAIDELPTPVTVHLPLIVDTFMTAAMLIVATVCAMTATVWLLRRRGSL